MGKCPVTCAPSMALACAAALPCGLGIQVIGPPDADAHVLQAAHALEEALALDAETARPLPHLTM